MLEERLAIRTLENWKVFRKLTIIVGESSELNNPIYQDEDRSTIRNYFLRWVRLTAIAPPNFNWCSIFLNYLFISFKKFYYNFLVVGFYLEFFKCRLLTWKRHKYFNGGYDLKLEEKTTGATPLIKYLR